MQVVNKQTKSKKFIIAALLAFIILSISGYLIWQQRNRPDSSAQLSDGGTIKYEPATGEEKKQTEQHKDNLVKNREKAESEAQNLPANGKRTVTPVITLAQLSGSEVTIQAYVPGIYEEGGSCTATLKNGTQTVVKQSSAFANATTTDCQHMVIPRGEFPSTGTWNVTVTYSSSKAEGVSNQQSTVEVT